jgi:hypothetical protein
MAGNRNLAIDLWTRAGLVACGRDARLLFVAMQNFADDHGVQPLVPGAIRLQVFPADTDIDDARVRAMIEELVANKLARIYEAAGQEYVVLVDWANLQRVPRRGRSAYPVDPSAPRAEAAARPARASRPIPVPPDAEAAPDEPADPASERRRWCRTVGRSLQHFMPNCGPPGDTEAWIDRWIADGCDLHSDVLPAISVACRPSPDRKGPPSLAAVAAYVEANRVRRLAVEFASQTM